MQDIKTNRGKSSIKGTLGGSAPALPVVDIYNNLITVSNFLAAIQGASLPSAVVSANPALATEYADWQVSVWESFWGSLLNEGIMAQAQEIKNLINLGITDQAAYQGTITNPNDDLPTVIDLIDDVLSEISAGNTYLTQLQQVASQIKGVDQQKIDQLNTIVNTLNSQFNDLEDQLTETALDNSVEVFVTTIEVAVAVATEEDPISPLVKGIAKLGSDIVKELMLSAEINATLLQLETAWEALDEETLQLAQVNLILNQLNTVLTETSQTLTSLNDLVNEWQTIADVIDNDSPTDWQNEGLPQLKEWSTRMCKVQFYGLVNQEVSAS